MYEEKYQNDYNPCQKRIVSTEWYNGYREISSDQFCDWKKNTCNRLLGEIKGLDAQKLEEWKKSADEKRLAEEKKLAEDKKAEEIKRIEEENRANEEKLKLAEIKKVEEERARAEELRIIEENRRLEEELAKEQERLRKEKRIADLNEIYGFRCEWVEWNNRETEAFSACLEEKAYQSQQELLREENERQDEIARAKEEEAIQIAKAKEIALKKENEALLKKEKEVRAKMIELKYAELEDSYGYKCQSSGNLNNKDKFRKCLTKTAEEEQERERVQSENELRLAKIELEIAKTNAKNKELEAEIASVKADNMKILKEQVEKQKKANDEARLAMIAAQNAANEYARQQNALLEKQLNEEKSRRKQKAFVNFLDTMIQIQSTPSLQRVPSNNKRCRLDQVGGSGFPSMYPDAFANDYWIDCY